MIHEKFANKPRLNTITLTDVLKMKLCWDPEDLNDFYEHYFGPEPVNARRVYSELRGTEGLRPFDVQPEELLWLLLQPEWYRHPEVVLRWFVCDMAEQFIENFHVKDEKVARAVELGRRMALGQTVDLHNEVEPLWSELSSNEFNLGDSIVHDSSLLGRVCVEPRLLVPNRVLDVVGAIQECQGIDRLEVILFGRKL